jgi:hypothetical protein
MTDYVELGERFTLFYNKLKKYGGLCANIVLRTDDSTIYKDLVIEEINLREELQREYGELASDIHGMAGDDSFTEYGITYNAFTAALDYRLKKDNTIKWNGINNALSFLNRAIGSCKKAQSNPRSREHVSNYVSIDRIVALKEIKSALFDLSKAIKILEEINVNVANKCFYGTIFLIRAFMDHIPPIFKFKTFKELANNYDGGKSFKAIMQKLEESTRKIADLHIHTIIREKEILPNDTQIDFRAEIDCLIAEICRVLSK